MSRMYTKDARKYEAQKTPNPKTSRLAQPLPEKNSSRKNKTTVALMRTNTQNKFKARARA